MKHYTIKPLKVGSILYYRGAFSSNQDQYKEKEEFPVIMFLIEGENEKILVDTGCGDPDTDSMKISYHGPSARPLQESPDYVLRAAGAEPGEIKKVIITHLHWDHCYNNHLFPNAEFYVQKSEMHNAIDPLPKFERTYEAFCTGAVPPWARQRTKWKYIDGDYDLADGIRLVHIPGHSLGLQGVLVETEKGPHFIASDMVPLYDNIQNGEFLVSGLCASLECYYESIEKVKRLNAVVIPSHDYLTLKHKSFPE